MMFEYPIKITKDDNGTFLVTCPDVPEAITFGDTREEAIERAGEALEVALAMYVDDWRILPKASAKGARLYAAPSIQATMKLAIYKVMREGNIRKTDLARRMGVALMQIDRILDVTHHSRIEQLEGALQALGCRYCVEMETA